ncbi:uncharacterized protein N7473_004752 [Penicillium subrubescens]|uniref:Peroxin 11C n=1 Tax=Penicillium subrubescens TaxID=1316194 RepID=A0A1Q5UHJ2_9EURO|nr:uncharacterized protein N7473_004752 [Penicillium subrubescens]KAJ5900682.1 hypothetical protein N7473_004752 [Penicillium subrubescens]OKP11923.1 hypothetical protein PENSUB_2475 [Penicillium subrubescens]
MSDPAHPPDTPNGAADHVQHVGKSAITAGKAATQQQLLSALTATDVTIRRLDLLLSTATGQERVLATVNYVASILHHVCGSTLYKTLQTRLLLLARIKARSAPTPGKSAPSGSKWAALSSLASETRYNLRLFGLLPLWIWGSETLKNPPTDPIIYSLTMLQVVSNVIYQLLENVAYLASKNVLSKKFVDKYGGIDKWYIWSTRGWFGHIFFEFFVLWRQHILRKRRLAAQREAAGNTETKEEIKAEEKEALRLEIRSWRKSLVNNTIWAPLCLHWCLEKGIGIPESLTGLISFMAGAWSLHDQWTATAKAI